MIAKTISLLALLGVALAAQDLTGVDPNTLKCDPTGQEFLLLPHFTNCSKFFMCNHGKEVEFDCPKSDPELVFDFVLQTCNWPDAATCTLRTPPPSTPAPSGSEEDIEGSGAGEDSGELNWGEDSTRARVDPVVNMMEALHAAQAPKVDFSSVLDCKSSNAAAKQAAYKGDCQRYWRCVNGLPHTFYCSDGLFFNEQKMQCDFEANVKCSVSHDEELKGEYMMYK